MSCCGAGARAGAVVSFGSGLVGTVFFYDRHTPGHVDVAVCGVGVVVYMCCRCLRVRAWLSTAWIAAVPAVRVVHYSGAVRACPCYYIEIERLISIYRLVGLCLVGMWVGWICLFPLDRASPHLLPLNA